MSSPCTDVPEYSLPLPDDLSIKPLYLADVQDPPVGRAPREDRHPDCFQLRLRGGHPQPEEDVVDEGVDQA